MKATWKKNETPVVKPVNKYTVTFYTDGGSNISSQTIEEGKTVTKPSEPTKEGYTFKGWYLNDSLYNFDSKVTSNITLKAKWSQKTYIVEANPVDQTSPFSRRLTVYEDGKEIIVKTIQYSDGVIICSGSNPNVNYYAINGENNVKLVLNGGNVVTATLKVN